MSEAYGYACCTCFRDGLTTTPPRADIELGLDAFGNVVTPGADPEAILEHLADWVFEGACRHCHGRLIEEIFLNSWRVREALGAAALDSGARRIHDVLVNQARYAFDGTIVRAATAPAVLAELERLPQAVSSHRDCAYDLSMLRRLCEVSATNGDPVVWYYSGHSLGYW